MNPSMQVIVVQSINQLMSILPCYGTSFYDTFLNKGCKDLCHKEFLISLIFQILKCVLIALMESKQI